MSPQFLVVPAVVAVFALVLSRVVQAWPRTLVRTARLIGSTRALVAFYRHRHEALAQIRAIGKRERRAWHRAELEWARERDRAESWRTRAEDAERARDAWKKSVARLELELARERAKPKPVDLPLWDRVFLPSASTSLGPTTAARGEPSAFEQEQEARRRIQAIQRCGVCSTQFSSIFDLWKHRGAVHENQAKGEKK